MAPRFHLVGLVSFQHVGNVAGPESEAAPLLHSVHTGEDFLPDDEGVSNHLQLVQTIVAGFAGGLFIILVEIFRQNLVPAMRLGAEMIEALEFVQHDLLLGRILQQGPPGEVIASPIEHVAGSGKAVSAGPAGLLVIVLDAFGHGRMDHIADIGAVDPHAKGNGGHHDIDLFAGKLVLMGLADFIGKAGMVGKVFEPKVVQSRGEGIHIVPAQAVDNSGFIRVFFQEVRNLA